MLKTQSLIFLFCYILIIDCENTVNYTAKIAGAHTNSFLFWPNATVPFYINPDNFDQQQSQSILKALSTFDYLTCLKFVPVMTQPSDNEHVLVFVNPEGTHRCKIETSGHSVYRPHTVTLGYDCLQPPQIDMVIMKALGFPFEHNRMSRDIYIYVMMQNIEPDAVELFTKAHIKWLPRELRAIPYDIDSVMHFGEWDYSKNGHKTIMFKNSNIRQRRKGLTRLDLRKIEAVYGPTCQERDRKDKLEICQSVPSFRRKRDIPNERRSLRINPNITPPPNITDSSNNNNNVTKEDTELYLLTEYLSNRLTDLGVTNESQQLIELINKVTSAALKTAKDKYCNKNNTFIKHDLNSKQKGVLGILESIADHAETVIETAMKNRSTFCSEADGIEKYERKRCEGSACPGYVSTRSGSVKYLTKHWPQHFLSTGAHKVSSAYALRSNANHTNGTSSRRKREARTSPLNEMKERKKKINMVKETDDDEDEMWIKERKKLKRIAEDSRSHYGQYPPGEYKDRIPEEFYKKDAVETSDSSDDVTNRQPPTLKKIHPRESESDAVRQFEPQPLNKHESYDKDRYIEMESYSLEQHRSDEMNNKEKKSLNTRDNIEREAIQERDTHTLNKPEKERGRYIERVSESDEKTERGEKNIYRETESKNKKLDNAVRDSHTLYKHEREGDRYIETVSQSDEKTEGSVKKINRETESKNKNWDNFERDEFKERDIHTMNKHERERDRYIETESHSDEKGRSDEKYIVREREPSDNRDDERSRTTRIGLIEERVNDGDKSYESSEDDKVGKKRIKEENKGPRGDKGENKREDSSHDKTSEESTEATPSKDLEPVEKSRSEVRLPRTVYLSKKNKEFYDERKWPGGVVRYVITPLPGYDLGDLRRRIKQVTDILHRKTCVRVLEITEDQATEYEDYLVVDDSPDYVTGRVGGRQNFGTIELFQGGQHRQHTAMMIMAMLGFYFEVSRHDRDVYLRVHNRHIRPGLRDVQLIDGQLHLSAQGYSPCYCCESDETGLQIQPVRYQAQDSSTCSPRHGWTITYQRVPCSAVDVIRADDDKCCPFFSDKLHHFEKIREEATLDLPYDYVSATQPAWQFWRKIGRTGISTVATYKDKDPDGSIMKALGQNKELLSPSDIVKINSVYGVKCFKKYKEKSRNN